MLKPGAVVLTVILAVAAAKRKNVTAAPSTSSTKWPAELMSTSSGAPVEYRDATSTLNTNLLANDFLLDALTHATRERIPERVVHSLGTGAFGEFEVTHDISHICKAKLFSKVGKKTPIIARLSQTFAFKGASDLSRETRGFAIKFKTEEGNWDLVGFNIPVYAYKDPVKFITLAHAPRPNPATNLMDPNSLWDFITLNPETAFAFLHVFSDNGIPDGYDRMSGHSIQTLVVYNEKGRKSFVRFHWLPCAGRKNLNTTEAIKIGSTEPAYLTRKLYDNISNKKYPTWLLYGQILSQKDVDNAGFDIFDVTKIIPTDKYPLSPIGKLTLNKIPSNHFAEIEQLALTPGNMVPGILGGCDKIYETRRLAYKDAHNYRLGPNHNKIPVNCPMRTPVLTYNRDGPPPVGDNGEGRTNYYPNSFNGASPYIDKNRPALPQIHEEEADNFEQIADFYSKMDNEEKMRVVQNIILSLRPCKDFIKCRAIKMFTNIHAELGKSVGNGLAMDCKKYMK